MPDVDVLRELSGQFQRPRFDDLVAVSRQRRRRTASGVVAGVVVVTLALGVTAAGLSDGRRSHEPMPAPSPTPSVTEPSETVATDDDWTPERVRAEGTPLGAPFDLRLGPAPDGLDAELYCVGDDGCDDFPPDLEGRTSHLALEMTQGGQLALFDVQGRPWARYFGEDSILVEDGFDPEPRFRLLYADGTALQLSVVSGSALAAPGPDVTLVQGLEDARNVQFGPEGPGYEPYLVDDRAATLQLMDVPRELEWWGPNVDELLWGGDDCRVMWQRRDGTFDRHDVDCRDDQAGTTDPGWNWPAFADWLEPGRMAIVEWSEDGHPLALHASVDGGATWQRVEIEDREWGDTTATIAAALGHALGELD